MTPIPGRKLRLTLARMSASGATVRIVAAYHDQPCKKYARLRFNPQSALLWAGNPDDWAIATRKPHPPLVCPEKDCDVELIAYENPGNRYNPRIFKFKAGSRTCDHWTARGLGGGPETPQHDWVKNWLATIARRLGYTAVVEHQATHADVFVEPPASFCLEVQLWSTPFRKRTDARRTLGADVCWLIRDGLNTPKVRKALFGLPAVRFRVIDKVNHRPLTPWDRPEDRDLARRARLEVWGTVAFAPPPHQRHDPAAAGTTWFRTRSLDGYQFLDEILSERRRWYEPQALDRDQGLWVLETDVADYHAFREQQRQFAARASQRGHRPLPASSPPVSNQPCPEAPQPPGGPRLPADKPAAGKPSTSPRQAATPLPVSVPPTSARPWWRRWRLRKRL